MVLTLPSTDPIRPALGFGDYAVTCRMYVADRKNTILREITDAMIAGTVEVDWDADINWTLRAELEGDPFTSLREFLRPEMTETWTTATGAKRSITRQLGLYMVMPPKRTVDRGTLITHVDGRDPLYLIAQGTAARAMSFGNGWDCGDVAKTILANNVDTDIAWDIPQTGIRTGRPRRLNPGDNLLAYANDAMQAAGFSKVTANHEGFLSASPLFRLVDVETPTREISTDAGDNYDVIELDPDAERYCTMVYLKSNNPTADKQMLEGYRVQNRDPNDPFSIPNVGYVISKEIVDGKDESMEALKKRAYKKLEQASSLQTMVRMTDIQPDPRIFPNDVWSLDLKQDDGTRVVPKGKYYAAKHRFDLVAGTQETTCRFLPYLSEVA